jgi:hypothetical protein
MRPLGLILLILAILFQLETNPLGLIQRHNPGAFLSSPVPLPFVARPAVPAGFSIVSPVLNARPPSELECRLPPPPQNVDDGKRPAPIIGEPFGWQIFKRHSFRFRTASDSGSQHLRLASGRLRFAASTPYPQASGVAGSSSSSSAVSFLASERRQCGDAVVRSATKRDRKSIDNASVHRGDEVNATLTGVFCSVTAQTPTWYGKVHLFPSHRHG